MPMLEPFREYDAALAHVFVIAALVRILIASPAADVINEENTVVGRPLSTSRSNSAGLPDL